MNKSLYIVCVNLDHNIVCLHCTPMILFILYSLPNTAGFYSFVVYYLFGLSYFLLLSCSKKGPPGKENDRECLACLMQLFKNQTPFHRSTSTVPQLLRVLPWSQSIILPKKQSSLSQKHKRACANVFANFTKGQNKMMQCTFIDLQRG